MVAQSRGAKLHRIAGTSDRIGPARDGDDSLLSKALQDVADEFHTTQGRYLEELDFWGDKILDRKPDIQLHLEETE